ncbi:MAG: glycoside hydrolase family 99-like domain-containing protein [Paludibacteraceae bacterium]|nr:glycoside hydrolase family 99-like domain-containing protein [Paludibacteraceae bacterium]
MNLHQKNKARVIAFYLPQFHPIPENDKWWGKGFTEWTNVAKAKPLFKGHYQPRVPADLGFYDLRVPEVREQQAQMAREAGIEGFCYWHYWFGRGKMLLEKPFQEVLKNGKPDFPFCLGWANHSWKTGTWTRDGSNQMIAEQTYGGEEDYRIHFEYVLPAFQDQRYITVDGKPIFVIFDPYSLPKDFIPYWRKKAEEKGLPGIHFVGYTFNALGRPIHNANGEQITAGYFDTNEVSKYYAYITDDLGFDAVVPIGTYRAEILAKNKYWFALQRKLSTKFSINIRNLYDYQKVMRHYYAPEDAAENVYPSLLPQWDRTARSGMNGIYINSTPEKFGETIEIALGLVKHKEEEHKILFLKSWNEWAEGNYVEPDLKFGTGFLDVLREKLTK